MGDPETRQRALVDSAIALNNTTLLEEAISMTPQRDLVRFYLGVLYKAISKNSIPILSCLIDHGVSVKHLRPGSLAHFGTHPTYTTPTKATLQFLLAHGWDMDWRTSCPPLMWFMTHNIEMVTWCLDHGASVTSLHLKTHILILKLDLQNASVYRLFYRQLDR
ncbi:hypothetical protein HBI37_234240 [Parastagonospora nodorum]|nr:hypothetical protein HBI64_230880 [Parastagonospora nodorum]KAH6322672.1 hypothetical protein HBI37_234240 [Parastagonospora nodorum]KAH6335272.1 hypothetical protein HBI36_232770 [Parastagonospora nodorum]